MHRTFLVIGAITCGMLQASANAAGLIDAGTGEGSNNWNYVHQFPGLALKESFAPFAPGYTGGVRVAVGDVNNDGIVDYLKGAGSVSQVIVFNGDTLAPLHNFFAYTPGAAPFGVYVAAGDINDDGYADIITGPSSEQPNVRAFDGQTGAMTRNFFAYGTGFLGGVRVASGDVNGDGYADIITGAGTGGSGHVKAFDGLTGAEFRSFLAYGAGYTGGVFVAAGDINGDGLADIITGADQGFASHVKAFNATDNSELRSFFCVRSKLHGGRAGGGGGRERGRVGGDRDGRRSRRGAAREGV